ncbi:ImmA/IrrE family metallo-endopeptidase [Nocardioides alkalitolerans]|uniref:ImmA/IrrE family metallo-endopeptidase n=1 Tax=Nocardioides alkalitolerans TaxID=281714 RepID=UPI0006948A39|nr:ImmA/IrrE family metallo-endopeptidase [Nocardioides alkalitolerans]
MKRRIETEVKDRFGVEVDAAGAAGALDPEVLAAAVRAQEQLAEEDRIRAEAARVSAAAQGVEAQSLMATATLDEERADQQSERLAEQARAAALYEPDPDERAAALDQVAAASAANERATLARIAGVAAYDSRERRAETAAQLEAEGIAPTWWPPGCWRTSARPNRPPRPSPRAPVRRRLAERLGVGVIHTLDPDGHTDNAHAGASRPNRLTARPTIALASALPGAEQRFTLAHELFHLMADQDLERGLTLVRDPRELRANRFAGALLLPAESAEQRIGETLTLHGYLKVKAEFGLSVGAAIHRAKDLGLISERRAKSLYIQWSSAGWRRGEEPVDVAIERPLLLDQALRRVYGRSHIAKASHETGVSAHLIAAWVEASDDSDRRAPGDVVQLASRAATRRPSK